jgi:hypothetical protein
MTYLELLQTGMADEYLQPMDMAPEGVHIPFRDTSGPFIFLTGTTLEAQADTGIRFCNGYWPTFETCRMVKPEPSRSFFILSTRTPWASWWRPCADHDYFGACWSQDGNRMWMSEYRLFGWWHDTFTGPCECGGWHSRHDVDWPQGTDWGQVDWFCPRREIVRQRYGI